MIFKSFDINKIDINKIKFFLLYGKNEGLKTEGADILLRNKMDIIKKYDEKEILDNPQSFIETIISQSLFEKERVIVINRVTDKLIKIIEEINTNKIDDILIIFKSDNLEKKSKIRSLFEKNKNFASIAFYPDTDQVLSKLAHNLLRKEKILISSSSINLIVNKCNGDREILLNELKKIKFFCKGGKKINDENIIKLTNLIENHSITELVDNCLAKNKKKILNIINENNFNNEDCIIIIRTFLLKSKKILKLSSDYEHNKNLDLTISSAKPPIFWKDKEITKQQIKKWTPKSIKKLIYNLIEIELLVKKNINNSINIIINFIIDQTSEGINN